LKPILQIEYEGLDATRLIGGSLLNLQISERFNERLSDARMTFEDRSGKWRDSWFPKSEDEIRIKIGNNGRERDFGRYVVYDVQYSGDSEGERIEMSAASGSEKQYERRWRSYVNMNLKQIVDEVAARLGLKPLGQIEGGRAFERQNGETDLSFLHRLAKRNGYVVKIETDKLVFYKYDKILESEVALTLTKNQVKTYRFEDKAEGSYKKCVVKGFNPRTRQVIEATAGSGEPTLALIETGIETIADARLRASEAIKENNRKKTRCEMTTIGDISLISGLAIAMSGFGVFDGKYVIEETQHFFTTSGYETRIQGIKQ
jgi:phage protein D